MKTLIISLVLVLLVSTGFTQLIKVNVLDDKVQLLELENGMIKYIIYQEKSKILQIVNPDRSIWKTIVLPLTTGHFLDEVKSISTNIFNNDPLVEILYTSVEYDYSFDYENPFNENDFMTLALNIINEKGEVLFREKEITDCAIIDLEGKKELLVYKKQDEIINKIVKTAEFANSK